MVPSCQYPASIGLQMVAALPQVDNAVKDCSHLSRTKCAAITKLPRCPTCMQILTSRKGYASVFMDGGCTISLKPSQAEAQAKLPSCSCCVVNECDDHSIFLQAAIVPALFFSMLFGVFPLFQDICLSLSVYLCSPSIAHRLLNIKALRAKPRKTRLARNKVAYNSLRCVVVFYCA
jgi:hypothetical protein